MKIKREYIPSMTVDQFADLHGLVMRVCERPLPEGDLMRYYARFERCEVDGDNVLIGEFGNGRTPHEAITNYAAKIELKRIILNAYRPERREIDVPRLSTQPSSGKGIRYG